MQAHDFIDETNSNPDSMGPKSAVRVVIAYNDLAAGKRAMRVISGFGKELGDETEFRLLHHHHPSLHREETA